LKLFYLLNRREAGSGEEEYCPLVLGFFLK